MADDLTPEQRRKCMAAIRSKDTKPEMIVRRAVHAMGYRYRLHRRELPGCPDLVLPKHRKAIFVHGCFWHAHTCRAGVRLPASNVDYWKKKRDGNVKRDKEAQAKLKELGWELLTIWECETKKSESLVMILKDFLNSGS